MPNKGKQNNQDDPETAADAVQPEDPNLGPGQPANPGTGDRPAPRIDDEFVLELEEEEEWFVLEEQAEAPAAPPVPEVEAIQEEPAPAEPEIPVAGDLPTPSWLMEEGQPPEQEPAAAVPPPPPAPEPTEEFQEVPSWLSSSDTVPPVAEPNDDFHPAPEAAEAAEMATGLPTPPPLPPQEDVVVAEPTGDDSLEPPVPPELGSEATTELDLEDEEFFADLREGPQIRTGKPLVIAALAAGVLVAAGFFGLRIFRGGPSEVPPAVVTEVAESSAPAATEQSAEPVTDPSAAPDAEDASPIVGEPTADTGTSELTSETETPVESFEAAPSTSVVPVEVVKPEPTTPEFVRESIGDAPSAVRSTPTEEPVSIVSPPRGIVAGPASGIRGPRTPTESANTANIPRSGDTVIQLANGHVFKGRIKRIRGNELTLTDGRAEFTFDLTEIAILDPSSPEYRQWGELPSASVMLHNGQRLRGHLVMETVEHVVLGFENGRISVPRNDVAHLSFAGRVHF